MRQFQEYAEPDESTEDRRRSGIKDEDRVLLPLDENVLTDNLGIPVVVVVTKVSRRHEYLDRHSAALPCRQYSTIFSTLKNQC